MKKKVGKKPARSAATLTMLDDFLKEQGKLEDFEAVAFREVRACRRTVKARGRKLRPELA